MTRFMSYFGRYADMFISDIEDKKRRIKLKEVRAPTKLRSRKSLEEPEGYDTDETTILEVTAVDPTNRVITRGQKSQKKKSVTIASTVDEPKPGPSNIKKNLKRKQPEKVSDMAEKEKEIGELNKKKTKTVLAAPKGKAVKNLPVEKTKRETKKMGGKKKKSQEETLISSDSEQEDEMRRVEKKTSRSQIGKGKKLKKSLQDFIVEDDDEEIQMEDDEDYSPGVDSDDLTNEEGEEEEEE